MQWLTPDQVTDVGWYVCSYRLTPNDMCAFDPMVYLNDLGQLRVKSTEYMRPQVKHLNPLYRLLGPIHAPKE